MKFKGVLHSLEDRVHRNQENLGLSVSQFERLTQAIICKTTSRNILNLPNKYSCQLMGCLVPKETVPSESILQLVMKILTSFRLLDTKNTIEQALRWLNCILQYSVCQTDDMEVLYELLLPLLHRQSLVSFFFILLPLNNTNLLPFTDISGNGPIIEDNFEQKIHRHKAKSKNITRS